MSAAHCLDDKYDIAEVRLGVTDLNNPKGEETHQRIKISKKDTIVHEKWGGSADTRGMISNGYDIMLIRLPEPAITNEDDSRYKIRPACLPFEDILEIE